MKKNLIKIVSLLLVVAVFAALLVACQTEHKCTSVCPDCGGCTNKECTEPACANKCKGHEDDAGTDDENLCPHACEYCFRCTDPTATGELCTEKCVCKDFAKDFKLNFSSPRQKIYDAKVRVMGGMEIGYVDGDTTHFADNSRRDDYAQFKDGVLKVRYAAVNTPESTGSVEPWGKKASDFTHNRLKNATHIIVEAESTTGEFVPDSTGSRYMGWVWYTNSTDANPASDTYRLLNLELLQYGLGKGSGTATSSYGDVCGNALDYAMSNKICVFNTEHKDPDFFYGTALPVSLQTLRANPSAYLNKKVAVEGVVSYIDAQTAYIQDEVNGLIIGFTIYYGYNCPAQVTNMLQIGNRVRLVGTVAEYNGSWQVSGLQYNPRYPNSPNNCKLISTGNKTVFRPTTAAEFVSKNAVTFTYEVTENGATKEVERTLDYCEAVLATKIAISNLKVTDVYTTTSGTSAGAMTLTCTSGGATISVRTDVLVKDGKTVTEDEFLGKTINIRGVVEYFNGSYQIKVFDLDSIEVVG